jgi:hypothetical protein
MLTAVLLTTSWVLTPRTIATPRTAVAMKQSVEEEKPQVRLEAVGTICEFGDGNKHDHAMLGIIKGAVAKAKGGGARYEIVDANEKVHSVSTKDIHCTCGTAAGKELAPIEALKPFQAVADAKVTDLGVDPEMLELAWEICADDNEHSSFSAEAVLSYIDAKLVQGHVQKYKAFRLLTSDLGKIFFKGLSHNQFKAKAAKGVAASKEMWCRAIEAKPTEDDFCLV